MSYHFRLTHTATTRAGILKHKAECGAPLRAVAYRPGQTKNISKSAAISTHGSLTMKEHFGASFRIRLSGALVSLALAAQSYVAANVQQAQGDPSIQTKIASALSAGPEQITKDATIAEVDAAGTKHVLRTGTNGWVCIPGDPNSVANPPVCEDKPSQDWDYAFRHHLPKPTNAVPGITYMLAGAEQRSDSDPSDKTSPPVKIGPHWMIMWPFDPKTTGLPTHHKPTGAYIMWAGTPYAHVHVMGTP